MHLQGSKHPPELNKASLDFIQERLIDSRVYIHFTGEKFISEKIVKEGFKYAYSFEKTTVEISHSFVDVKYKFQLHKNYGNFLIVICIPLSLFDNYKSKGTTTQRDALCNLGLSDHHPEEELNYTLSPRYVYGYIDLKHKKIFKNEHYLYKGP